jgi:hypothetical protein
MKKVLILILSALMLIGATNQAEVTYVGQLNCGATWCEQPHWMIYWFDTPGCARSRLFVHADELPNDCSMRGQIVTAAGYITYGGSGCYVLHARTLKNCFPTCR